MHTPEAAGTIQGEEENKQEINRLAVEAGGAQTKRQSVFNIQHNCHRVHKYTANRAMFKGKRPITVAGQDISVQMLAHTNPAHVVRLLQNKTRFQLTCQSWT